MQAADPFLNPGAGSNTISSSALWARVLSSENLLPTAGGDVVTTTIDGNKLGNISVTNTALKGVVYTSDGNYQYFLNTYPDSKAQTPAWNAAWLGDSNGCE